MSHNFSNEKRRLPIPPATQPEDQPIKAQKQIFIPHRPSNGSNPKILGKNISNEKFQNSHNSLSTSSLPRNVFFFQFG
jgi:hypothetical protein